MKDGKLIKLSNFTIIIICTLQYIYSLSENEFSSEKKSKINSIMHDNNFYYNLTLSFQNPRQYGKGICSHELNCHLPYGICLNSTLCICMPDYANTVFNSNGTDGYCSYRKKNIIVAGFLELFLPFGLGHFYSGHILLGSIKLSYNLLMYTFCYFIQIKFNPEDDNYFDLMVVCLLFSCLIPLWNVVDLFLFFTGSFNDGNGIEMT
jgi:TM2 domain-containing membrane protein YozV